jgi:hypothetical protein
LNNSRWRESDSLGTVLIGAWQRRLGATTPRIDIAVRMLYNECRSRPIRGRNTRSRKEVSRVDALEHVSLDTLHLNGLKPSPWRDARAASGFI